MDQKSANVGSQPRRSVPGRRLHKASGLAVVTLNGHDHYLGDYADPASKRKYDEMIARWLAGGRRPLHRPRGDGWPTVGEVAAAYVEWARAYYLKRGEVTRYGLRVVLAMTRLAGVYGSVSAADFGGRELETFRSHVAGMPGQNGRAKCRATVEESAVIVRKAFRWAVNRGLVPAERWMEMKAVERLPRGRSGLREGRKVGPAPADAVADVLGRVTPMARAILELMAVTGMRPCEACGMTGAALDRSGAVWKYRVDPEVNKTEHHGKERVVAIGPRGQEILGPWVEKAGQGPVFPGKGGGCYTPDNLYQLVWNWCRRLGVEAWHPNQLRHSVGTAVRRAHGLDGAQVVLGHAKADVTQCYADASWDRAEKIALEMG